MELQWYDIRQLDAAEEARIAAMMDDVRRRRVADIAGEDDRKRTVAGELLARRMLAEKLHCSEADVPLTWDELGKPTVTTEGTYVSVSHSGACCGGCAGRRGRGGHPLHPGEIHAARMLRGGDGLHPSRRQRRLPPVLGGLDGQGSPVQADGQRAAAGAEPFAPAGGRDAGLHGEKRLCRDGGRADFVKKFAKCVKKGFSTAPEFVRIAL